MEYSYRKRVKYLKKVTAQKVFFWNILGSMSSAAVSVILLFIVTRALNSASADIYSFAYAIANLFVIVASFQVRDFQATDIREKYSFDTYFVTRIISNVAMVLLLVTYLIFNTNTHSNIGIIFWVSFFRVSEALSDVFQGLFQQKERLDIAGEIIVPEKYHFNNCVCFNSGHLKKSIVVRDRTNHQFICFYCSIRLPSFKSSSIA